MRMKPKRCVILVGHGGIPTDCPPRLVRRFKRLEARAKGRPSPELAALDARLRSWPRNSKTDPYQGGLEAVAAALRRELKGRLVLDAYNEFSAPSLEQAFDEALRQGALEVTVVTTMYTRGGIHSETEIPAILAALGRRHPQVTLRYAWPFDLKAVARLLAGEIRRAQRR